MPRKGELFEIAQDFPVKGKVENSSSRNQPEGTTPDCLNVLPYDVFSNRPRGGQRPGTDNVYLTALPGPVQGIVQVTTALDPTAIVADQATFTEPFTYTNGPLSSANPLWVTASGTATVASNAVQLLNNTTAYYSPVFALGSAHILKASFKINSHTGSVYALSIQTRVKADGTGGVAAQLQIDSNTLTLYADGSAVSSIGVSSYDDGLFHTLEMRVNGNTFKLYIDSVLKLTATTTVGVGRGNVAMGTGTTGSLLVTFDDFQLLTGKNLTNLRQTNVVVVAAGNVYIGSPGAVPATGDLTLCTGGTAALASGYPVSMAAVSGKVYMVDGVVAKVLDVATSTVSTLTATAGTIPTKCTIAAIYRDRLILAAPTDTPQNFSMSRVGTHTDFDYSQVDAAAAFAGNASTAGRIGDPITAVMPFTDDLCIIGGDHNLWRITGDLADGGSIDLLSASVGVAGFEAYDQGPDGTIYFVGPGGLYRMPSGGGTPDNMDGNRLSSFFAGINRQTQYVTLAWDTDRQGLWVFVTPANSGTATHLFWDARMDGFFPQQFPANHGPLSALVFDGDDPTDRALLLGGRDGYIRKITNTSYNDDGTAVSSYVYLTPIRPNGDRGLAILDAADVYLGNSPGGTFGVTATLQAGYDTTTVTTSPKRSIQASFTTDKRQPTIRRRLGGGAFVVKLSNSTINRWWNFERIVLTFKADGERLR